MHPRTDFLLRSPLRLPWPRKQGVPLWSKRRTRPGVNTPCFIGKPCLSHPPVILKTYPLNSSPKAPPKTSCEILLSQNARSFMSSSISSFFWQPVVGFATLNFIVKC
uniref:Uncharacterized protein n=1 Tax=Medicago truncatula TaxID=3880 RepID=I3SRV9_MEDTR|nr:unknown [Medicago truncatula]